MSSFLCRNRPIFCFAASLLVLLKSCNAASTPSVHRKYGSAAAASASPLFPPASVRGIDANPALANLLDSTLVSPLSYNATVLNAWGFKPAQCGRGDFLVANTGMVDRWICAAEGEQLVTAAMDEILSKGCRKKKGGQAVRTNALFVDVGSNSGFYGLNAISHGCVAAFFDVQPGCNKVVNGALLVNGFTDHGVVMAAGLSDRQDIVPASSESTCSLESGRYPISAMESNSLQDGDVNVPVLPLSHLLPSTSSSTRVFMMKIDTEGLEQRVLAGAMPLFKKRAIDHVIVEVTPGKGGGRFLVWEKQGVSADDVAKTMRDIAACGYSFTNLKSKSKTTDPKLVREMFAKRDFDQADFLITRVR